jgi:membrane associated rhomboid family serine protease
VATYGLVLALAAIFLYEHLVLEPEQREQLRRTLGLVPGRLIDDPGAAWPMLISHVFLHGSLLHLLGNGIFLWVFGRALEGELRWAFLPTFLLLGALAGLGSVLLRWDSDVPGIGASGAISGLMGAYLVLFPDANVRVLVFALAPFTLIFGGSVPAFDVPAWIFLPLWLGLQLFGGLGAALSPSGVDFGAHVVGFLAGFGMVRVLRAAFGLWPDEIGRRLGYDPLLQPATPATEPYLTLRGQRPAGHVLERGDLQVVSRKSTYLDPDAVPARYRETIIGRTLKVERYRYEPLLWSDLEPLHAGAEREARDPAER